MEIFSLNNNLFVANCEISIYVKVCNVNDTRTYVHIRTKYREPHATVYVRIILSKLDLLFNNWCYIHM